MIKLKCKPCRLFFKDTGEVGVCPKCGGDLRRITVHYVNPKNLVINSDSPMQLVINSDSPMQKEKK